MIRRIGDVDAAAWDRLEHGGSPFLRHGFLSALEETGSIGRRSGWEPRYVLAERAGALVGAAAAFVKDHSFGEFIFDWEWAHASQRAGIDYYPKLVVAAPLTPATGPRLLRAPGLSAPIAATVGIALVGEVERVAEEEGCSSVHVLFCTEEERDLLADAGPGRAGQLPVPLAQPRLPRLRRLPGPHELAPAQAAAQGAQPGARGGRRHRDGAGARHVAARTCATWTASTASTSRPTAARRTSSAASSRPWCAACRTRS